MKWKAYKLRKSYWLCHKFPVNVTRSLNSRILICVCPELRQWTVTSFLRKFRITFREKWDTVQVNIIIFRILESSLNLMSSYKRLLLYWAKGIVACLSQHIRGALDVFFFLNICTCLIFINNITCPFIIVTES